MIRNVLLVLFLTVVAGLGCACEEGPMTEAGFVVIMSNVEYNHEQLYQPQPGWWTAGDWRTYHRERINEDMALLSLYPDFIRQHQKQYNRLKQLQKDANNVVVDTE